MGSFGRALAALAFGLTVCAEVLAMSETPEEGSYTELVDLFGEWREFHNPPLVDGAPDYGVAAMQKQHQELAGYRARLEALDTSGWSIAQKVDRELVRAEMNGLDFNHRVLKPWVRDPTFYANIYEAQSDTPAHEGQTAIGEIELWQYDYPLDEAASAKMTEELRAVPPLLERARVNLTGNTRDLWEMGISYFEAQTASLTALHGRVGPADQALHDAITAAESASSEFHAWLESELPNKTGPSGIGVENYNWYARNVHLNPFTWQDEVDMMTRELDRALSSLALEQHRNRNLPEQMRIANAEEYDQRMHAGVDTYMAFLDKGGIVTVKDYMDPAMRAQVGSFTDVGPDGLRHFFDEVKYRDPVVMQTHFFHWIELGRIASEPHANPIRSGPLLHNIFDGRSEGLATGMEEMLMHAGLFDDRPRSKELVWIMLAQRAARALGGLMMHSNDMTMAEAREIAASGTPRGWMPADSGLNRFEQHFYLRQPGYGSSYIVGKVQIDALMAAVAQKRGDEFTVKSFMDDMTARGVIPVSLLRWEMTGSDAQLKEMNILK